MAANDKDMASSSSMPSPDDEYINWDLLKVETEEEYEKEKAIANDKAITHGVHETELISKAEGMADSIVSDKVISHLLVEEVEMGGESNTNDGEKEEEEDEEMGSDSDTDEEKEEEMGGNSDMTNDDEEEEDEKMDR
ncbi:acidic leucine-rich nuclear phosphoprotein 32-related protein 2-like [Phragmites australis]|uniref:acidic leucine-rich nuclear phosphoprotein 32-related protein 2-like n=1 Tax=Phragmites australis TaxID=29695 RepID=UPI002D76BE1B|nr:acidic leucine-rich nuclear phosphoprotein 32-related protein 2-like [Phragmites australis]